MATATKTGKKKRPVKIIRSACHACYIQCGVLGHVQDGKIVKITGDPENPVTHGSTCPKGRNFAEYAHHPDRLKYPMKRVGERGEGRWERISWDQALDEIAEKLNAVKEKYGPLAIAHAPTYGRFTMLAPFLRALGSPNLYNTTDTCEGAGFASDYVTFGAFVSHFAHASDYAHAKTIVMWGTDVSVSFNPHWVGMTKRLQEDKDVKLVVIDPRKTKPAGRAHLWLQIRPGGDGALALAALNVIINEELYDKDFVSKWTVGFDKLCECVQAYPPEKAEKLTWIPAKKIRQFAHLYATHKPSTIYNRCGLTQQTNSFGACRAYACLIAITGNLDVPGGNILPKRLKGLVRAPDLTGWGAYSTAKKRPFEGEKMLPQEVEERQIGAKRFPLWSGPTGSVHQAHMVSIYKALLHDDPYPLRALILHGLNPVVTAPNTHEVINALKTLDLYVQMEHFMTPSGELADYVLPACTWAEKEELGAEHEHGIMIIRQPLIDPPGEAWEDRKFIIELAKKMKLENFPKWNDIHDFNEWRLKETGITFEELRRKGIIRIPWKYREYEEHGFKTPSGKVELYSSLCEKFDYNPLPYYVEPWESELEFPELADEYPLIFTGRREYIYYHSQGHNLKWARRKVPNNTLEIHPDAAKKCKVKDGDWVYVENPKKRRIRVQANVTDKTHPEVVSAIVCWWCPEKEDWYEKALEQNINVLADSDPPYDHVAGTPRMRRIPVRVYKA